jgi:hypothetical protein
MTPMVIVIGIVAVPAVALTFFRANATLVFLSLCLGQVLVQFAGEEAARTVGIIASDGSTNQQAVSLALLFLPVVFATLFTVRSISNHLHLVLNLLPAVAAGVLGLLLAEPYFSAGLQGSISGSDAWYWIQKTQVMVVTTGAILSLFFLWLQRPRHHAEGKHHK